MHAYVVAHYGAFLPEADFMCFKNDWYYSTGLGHERRLVDVIIKRPTIAHPYAYLDINLETTETGVLSWASQTTVTIERFSASYVSMDRQIVHAEPAERADMHKICLILVILGGLVVIYWFYTSMFPKDRSREREREHESVREQPKRITN